MRPRSLAAPFALALASTACTSTPAPPPRLTPPIVLTPPDDGGDAHEEPKPGPVDERQLPFAASSNAFGADLYARLAKAPGNVAFSPLSIASALTMTWAGARGETAEQMRAVLHLGADRGAALVSAGSVAKAYAGPHGGYELGFANQLFGEATYPFDPRYLTLSKETFGAPLRSVDFAGHPDAGRDLINAFVSERTHDRVRDLMPEGSVHTDTRLVLVNAVYMKTKWVHAFPKDATYDESFLAPGGSAKTPTMHLQSSLGYAEVDGTLVLDMPYKGGDLAMTVLLPKAPDGLAELEKRLGAGAIERFVGATKTTEVAVSLPRFKVSTAKPIELSKTLADLGMSLAFSDAADLGAMGRPGAPRLRIDDAYHKAFVEVNEEGTEAAAATGVGVGLATAVPPAPVAFRADHPFVYVVRDVHTNLVLFVGRVVDPRA